ncbi:MAG: LysR family transcriptional regulator [SAR324 cluster bacterium]|jgi:DNA-binding transcriptional LysR family regulator|nr:LysR family transcriptional regulator [SAR324 cluster bacterium]
MNQWDDLKLFLAVAKLGTLTAAAAELGSNVATLHRRLKSFEESFELSLFEKGPRGYRLTSAGEQLLSHAEEIEESIFTAFRAVVGHDQQATGEVRITLPQAMVSLMTPHLVDFSGQFENIRVILLPDDGLLDLERNTDVAFRFTCQPLETAVGRNLADIAWCRYASKSTKGTDLPWLHHMGLERNHVILKQQEAMVERKVMQIQGVAGMLMALKNSATQGLLPCFVGDLDTEMRRVGEPFDAKHQLWLLIHVDLKRSARVRAFLDFVVPRLLAQRNLFKGILA